MSGIVSTKAQKYTRRDGSLILIFGEAAGTGAHQQFDFLGTDEVADRIVTAWNSYASSQAEIERLRTALAALLKQSLQSELNTPAHEWGWEAIQGAIAVLPDFAALSGIKE